MLIVLRLCGCFGSFLGVIRNFDKNYLFLELYLMPKDHEYGPDYASGKMLIAHARGNTELKTVEDRQINSQVLSGGLMLAQLDPLKSVGLRQKISRDASWNEDFHTYTLIWRPGNVLF